MLFYIVFIVGISNIEKLDESSFNHLIIENLEVRPGVNFMITTEVEENQKSLILGTENYSDILEKGATVIKNWN